MWPSQKTSDPSMRRLACYLSINRHLHFSSSREMDDGARGLGREGGREGGGGGGGGRGEARGEIEEMQ